MPCNTRAEQVRKFTSMRIEFELWIQSMGWMWREGESARTREYAEILAKDGRGTLDSYHIYGLAKDYWLLSEDGLKVLWIDARYAEMGEKWESLGGWWGGRRTKKMKDGRVVGDPDVYHVDLGEKPIKK